MWNKLLSFDNKVLVWVNNFANDSASWQKVFKLSGIYLIYLVPAILVFLWFWSTQSKKVALRAVFSGAIAWLVIANILGHIINRARPYQIQNIHEIVFHRPSYSFPSDHASFLFAVALSLNLSGYRRLSWVLFAIAILVAIARVGLGFHYPSDVIAGAILGMGVAWLVWLFDKPLNYIYLFIIGLAKKVRLA